MRLNVKGLPPWPGRLTKKKVTVRFKYKCHAEHAHSHTEHAHSHAELEKCFVAACSTVRS